MREGGREGRGHALARVVRVHREAECVALAAVLAVHDFILSLPQKYSTCVGENSVSLSGGKEEEHICTAQLAVAGGMFSRLVRFLVVAGQKQRIAVARALIRRPDVRPPPGGAACTHPCLELNGV